MVYFLGRDVDVFVTLECAAADVAIGTEDPDSTSVPVAALIGTGTVSAGGTVFANAMDSVANVSGSRVIDLTGVDLSISASDEDIGPFIGQASTQSVELRKETVVSLTRKKSDEVWDVIFNGPSNGMEFQYRYIENCNLASASTTLSSIGTIGNVRVGQYAVNGNIPAGTVVVTVNAGASSCVISNAATATAAAANVAFLDQPTFKRQGARYGVAYTGSTAVLNAGRANPKQNISGTSYGNAGESVYYGYRVHLRMKNGSENYTVKNCAMTGHTIALNSDGTSEETLELSSGVASSMYTGSSDTFYTTLTTVGEM